MLCRLFSCLLVLCLHFPVSALAASLAFGPATPATVSVGMNPQAGILVDVNGNGVLDLVTANSGAGNSIAVLLGNGNGTFAAATSYTVGNAPNAVIAGDFDRDNDPDLVVVNSSSDNVAILRNNGSGTFVVLGSYATGPPGSFPNGIAAGDFNSDGKLDLAVANFDGVGYVGDLAILRGNGDGTFAAATHLVVTNPLKVITGDFNNDGDLDLATANAGPNSVSILLGNGAGTFAAAVNYAVGSFPSGIAAGDLDGDGDPDLITANRFGNSISILLGNGNGTFGAAANMAAGSQPVAVAFEDLNFDGKLDVVVANNDGNSISLFRGNGNGTLQAATGTPVGTGPAAVATGDITGDGLADLVVANSLDNNVSVFRNIADLPVWTATYPKINTAGTTSVQVAANADRAGAAYLVCLPSTMAAPTSFQVRTGKNATGTTVAANFRASAVLAANTTALLSCSSLAAGTPYKLYTVAADGQGSLQARPTTLTFAVQADAPDTLAVPATSASGNYTVSWGASATAGASYVLQEATNSTFTTGVRTAYTGTAITFNITGRSQNVTYYYRVKATKAGYVDSAWKAGAAGCAVPGTTTAGVPASLIVPVADADGAYSVSWGVSATAGVAYELQEATNSLFTSGLRTVYHGTARTVGITGRSQNVTYYYRVQAVKGGLKNSGYRVGATGCAVPGTASAGAPASLTVPVADADGAYLVSWGASTTAGVTYELQEATTSNFTTGLRNAYRGTLRTVNITGRNQNVTYYYRVRAVKGGLKDSGYRGNVIGCAVPGTIVAGTPVSLTVPAADVDGAYLVSWGASVTAGVTYELQEATASNFSTGLRLAYRGTATTFNVTGRSSGTTYFYRVRAVKGGLKDSAYRVGGNGCRVGPPG